jgi:hypothetical protein
MGLGVMDIAIAILMGSQIVDGGGKFSQRPIIMYFLLRMFF